MAKPEHPPGPPTTLGNMRELGVQRLKLAEQTQRWAVTMTKVAIRQAVARSPFPRWHFVSFGGREGNESRGVVDLIAIRKDHGTPRKKLKRGDTFQIVLIQVKGGAAAYPTAEDGERLRAVARYHHAHGATDGNASNCYRCEAMQARHDVANVLPALHRSKRHRSIGHDALLQTLHKAWLPIVKPESNMFNLNSAKSLAVTIPPTLRPAPPRVRSLAR